MRVDPHHLLAKPLSYLEQVIAPLFDNANLIDSLVVGLDIHAASIASICSASGRVPGVDLALVSLVDSTLMQLNHPPITSVDLHPRELGARCGQLAAHYASGAHRGEPTEIFLQQHTFHKRHTS
jgi:DNA-binding LacI/PurR family transcriptional regulator